MAQAVVLAAGEGTRMRSPLPKVLHRVADRSMVDRVVACLEASGIPRIIVVVGFGRGEVREELDRTHPDTLIVVQEEQLGTGHAVRCALPLLEPGTTVGVFSGDTPLLTPDTVRRLFSEHREKGAAATLLTAVLSDPHGYGRVVRDASGLVTGIVEEKDADDEQRAIREINAGSYVFEHDAMAEALTALRTDNHQGEFYLTDTVGWLKDRGRIVAAVSAAGEETEVLGVNTPDQLAEAERVLTRREGGSG